MLKDTIANYYIIIIYNIIINYFMHNTNMVL